MSPPEFILALIVLAAFVSAPLLGRHERGRGWFR